jgi:hypothetical protein
VDEVTDITVKVDAETGAATIEMRGASVVEPRFRLRDAASERFLTRRGWSKTPSFLPGEGVTAADFTALALDPDLARRINPGMKLVLEQPTSNIFASLAWPGEAAADEAQEQADEERPAEAAEADDEKSADDKATTDKAADQNVGDPTGDGSKADEPALAATDAAGTDVETAADDAAGVPYATSNAPSDAQDAPSEPSVPQPDSADSSTYDEAAARDIAADTADKTAADADEPVSLEPAIRDEIVAPDRTETPVLARDRNWGRTAETATDDEDDDDDDDDGWPWGKLVAAAVAFTLLGSILTYFWQNSAYENELRTAMRAVEAQRDEIKTDLEKRLAEAESRAGAESSAAVTAAESSVASLTEKAESLTRDRDDARGALAEQQAKAKSLEERLATAQGEIDSLKQAAEANATEQTAVFNDRIEALGKDLDGARKELEAARAQLAERDRTIAKSTSELDKAKDQIASLQQASEEAKSARDEELQGRIQSLSEQLDKTVQDLATRDAALRDVQAKLSVADVQIEALKKVAGKATSADLEKSTLADRVAELTAQADKASQQLAAKDAELRKAKTSLDAANALLSKNAADVAQAKEQAAVAQDAPTADAATEQLKQERDLYAKELAAMTESLKALKAERDRLAAAAPGADATATSANAVAESRAIWGATAIDQTGAIYSLQNQISEKAASENALALCKGKSNGSCEPLRAYSNTCFSLARIEGEGPQNDNFGFSMDKDWKKAEAGAIRQCEELGADCTVRFTVCSPDGLSKPAVDQ